MPVVLDPDSKAVYEAFLAANRPPYENGTPAQAREMYLAARFVSNPEPPELESAKDIAIPAPHGSIPARIYTPNTLRNTQLPRINGEVRPGCEEIVSTAPLPNSPQRALWSAPNLTRRKSLPLIPGMP